VGICLLLVWQQSKPEENRDEKRKCEPAIVRTKMVVNVLYIFAEAHENLAKSGLGKEASHVAVGYLRVQVGRAHRQSGFT
jgi:hypothetical protein